MDTETLDKTLLLTDILSHYHRHKVTGIDNIPHQGPAIIVTNHSLATYDGFLLARAIYLATGRIVHALGDRRIFATPILSQIAKKLLIVEGRPESAEKLLSAGHLILIAPGGMKESLRSSRERYRIRWENRTGFIRLSLSMQVPIILAACPAADNIYDVYENKLTKFFYDRFKMPLPIARGIGLSFFPRPVELHHAIHAPITPPKIPAGESPEGRWFTTTVSEFHHQVANEMEILMQQSLNE